MVAALMDLVVLWVAVGALLQQCGTPCLCSMKEGNNWGIQGMEANRAMLLHECSEGPKLQDVHASCLMALIRKGSAVTPRTC